MIKIVMIITTQIYDFMQQYEPFDAILLDSNIKIRLEIYL